MLNNIHCLCVSKQCANFKMVQLKIIGIDFDEIWHKYSKYSGIEFACFSFRVGLFFYQLFVTTGAYKLVSRVFSIFLPNVIKIDSCNFQLYRFKVGSSFVTQHLRNEKIAVYTYVSTHQCLCVLLIDRYDCTALGCTKRTH